MKTVPPIIRSADNARVRGLGRLGRSGPYRDCFAAEGLRLVETLLEAPRPASPIRQLVLAESALQSDEARMATLVARYGARPDVLVLSDALFARLAGTETSQGVMLVLERPAATALSPEALAEAGFACPVGSARPPVLLVLESIQDPGNLGTLIRLAAAFAIHGVLLCGESCDPWQAKVVRATMGALWQLPIARLEPGAEPWAVLDALGWDLVASLPQGGQPLTELSLEERGRGLALLLGNEAQGLSRGAIDAATLSLTIPMPGPTESLNVAMAGAILIWELALRAKEN